MTVGSGFIIRFIRKMHTSRIRNRISAGKAIFFENIQEEIAFRYVPGETGVLGKYYAKYYGIDEMEVSFDSSSVLMGIMEGRVISKAFYNRYHLIKGTYKNRLSGRVCYENKEFNEALQPFAANTIN